MKDKEQLLWDYIDGLLSKEDTKLVEKRLNEDLDLAHMYDEMSNFDMELAIIQKTLEPINLIAQTEKKLASPLSVKNNNINLRPFFLFVLTISILFFAISKLPIESSETIVSFIDNIAQSTMLTWINNIQINAYYIVIMMAIPVLYFIDSMLSNGIRYRAVMV